MTTNTQDKAKLIESILKMTKKTGNAAAFDRLHDLEHGYLWKLLATCKNFKKAK